MAKGQQGQHVQPDARLAAAYCLQAAIFRMRSGPPFVPEPPVCIMLMEVASRVMRMASFAAHCAVRGCTDYAAQAAQCLHQLAQQLVKSSSANAGAPRSALTTGVGAVDP